MNKLKLFLENFIVYGIGGVISKIIPLIMVPIVTRIMPNSMYFGISDMSNTVVQFGSAIAIMGMYDAMYRMFFEKENEEYKKKICSTTLVFTIMTSLIVFIVMIILKDKVAHYFLGNREYFYVVYLSAIATLVGATNGIISAPTRMQNKRKIFLITNTISPILSYSISIPMLLSGHYIIALPLAGIVSGVTMEISFGILNRQWFDIRLFDFKLLKQLLVIAIPLLPNFLIYWIFNSCDKVMITNILGIEEAGIYSASSKLGQCSQLIYTAFAGGWQYFAFATMKEENQVKSNSLVFEYLGVISFIATAFICVFSYPIFKIIFTEEYLRGYVAAAYLFFAPLLQMLFQIAANQFLIVKKTWPNILVLSTGAMINILVNLVLIPIMGIEGAAISTLLGYIISDIICVWVLIKMNLMVISFEFIISSICMLIFLVAWRIFFRMDVLISLFLAMLLGSIYLLLYRRQLLLMMKQIRN